MLYTNNNTSLLGKLSSTSTTRKKKKASFRKKLFKKNLDLGRGNKNDGLHDGHFFFFFVKSLQRNLQTQETKT